MARWLAAPATVLSSMNNGSSSMIRASWDLLPVAAVKEFLAVGRPCVGWPSLAPSGQGSLTALTLVLEGAGEGSAADSAAGASAAGKAPGLVVHGARPEVVDDLVCSGLDALPLRRLDCAFLLLGGDGEWSAAAAALETLGRGRVDAESEEQPRAPPLVFAVAPGRVSAEALVALDEAGAAWGLGVATLRHLTTADAELAVSSPHLMEAARVVCGGGQQQQDFVVVQLQARASPWEEQAAATAAAAAVSVSGKEGGVVAPEEEHTAAAAAPSPSPTTWMLRLLETSLFLAQPPSPPDAALAPEDAEYLRAPPPAACALHLSNYHDDWRALYPCLQHLLADFEAIRAEALAVGRWVPWPEYHFRDGGSENDWRVVPFLHTFPASDPDKTVWIESTIANCPRTARALRRLRPWLRTALFSRLGPDTRLSAHTGWEDLANHVLRVHLTLAAPEAAEAAAGGGNRTCGTWVEGEVRCHRPREFIVFDDSKVHKAFNLHPTEARVVLIVDLARPPGMAPGVAVGGHTEELDAFISAFT